MSGTRGLLGWSWIFVSPWLACALVSRIKLFFAQIIEGMATVVVGLLAVLGKLSILTIRVLFITVFDAVLVDFPSTAAFLTPEERAFVVKKLSKHCGAANQSLSS